MVLFSFMTNLIHTQLFKEFHENWINFSQESNASPTQKDSIFCLGCHFIHHSVLFSDMQTRVQFQKEMVYYKNINNLEISSTIQLLLPLITTQEDRLFLISCQFLKKNYST